MSELPSKSCFGEALTSSCSEVRNVVRRPYRVISDVGHRGCDPLHALFVISTDFVLTLLGTFVYLYNGAVLFIEEFEVFTPGKKEMIMIGWCSKYIHVIADTFVLFIAFEAVEKRNVAADAERGSRAQQSAFPSSSEHGRMTVRGLSWLLDALPRAASGIHNVTTEEIRPPASFAGAKTFSSPNTSAEIGDEENNVEHSSSPLPPRPMLGRAIGGVTGSIRIIPR
eukprot:jgi/Undpi1/11972/HiC_scaffold_4.g01671.m1